MTRLRTYPPHGPMGVQVSAVVGGIGPITAKTGASHSSCFAKPMLALMVDIPRLPFLRFSRAWDRHCIQTLYPLNYRATQYLINPQPRRDFSQLSSSLKTVDPPTTRSSIHDQCSQDIKSPTAQNPHKTTQPPNRSKASQPLDLLADLMPVFPCCRRCRHCRGSC